MLSLPDFRYKQIIVHIVKRKAEKLRFRADNILIEDENKKVILQHSCHRIFALFIVGDISLTSVVAKYAVKYGFPIIMMNDSMKVYARINCKADGNTLLRIRQYTGQNNLEIARKIVSLKINNQISLLENLRYKSQEDKNAIEKLKEIDLCQASSSNQLMGLEGMASKIFFATYFRPLNWQRREPRCRRDIYNLLLDIGYTHLFNFIEGLLSLYGFDVYCGVYHTFFYQRKSLVCDLIEPFRCIIDRRLRKAYRLKQISEEDFQFHHFQYQLSWDKQGKYIQLFWKDILEEKENIFLFIQSYYRWLMKDKGLLEFPQYELNER